MFLSPSHSPIQTPLFMYTPPFKTESKAALGQRWKRSSIFVPIYKIHLSNLSTLRKIISLMFFVSLRIKHGTMRFTNSHTLLTPLGKVISLVDNNKFIQNLYTFQKYHCY